MDHFRLKNNIKFFLEGKLSIEEEKELLQWIKGSSDNEKYFHHLQKELGDDLIKFRNKNIVGYWKKFLQNVEPQLKKEITISYFFKKYYRCVASVAAAFFLGIVITLFIFWRVCSYDRIALTEQKINTPYGARTQFLLPDSSLVWLNSGSELVFPSKFSRDRIVKLKGEAYFEVKKDDISFIVSTFYGNVEVTGTSFNVKAYQKDIFETTLVRGEVDVITNNRQKAVLRPGLQAVYTEKGLAVEQVEAELYTSWTDGKLIFREEYLPTLTRRFERWYNVKIEIDDDLRLKDISYTGTLEMESFSEVLNLLSVTAPIDYTWNEKTRIIRIFYKE
jgi:transmembrane sensor